ncbi:hypothetical protein GCM10011577_39910 [Pseudarthrobacter polychromogenes]|uniref:Uncharacterized protein n=1 Tax=Pseudarthrobacter polychromogenes TaxID=1676 RepID=A0ABQ1Y495_9MICC|nr:hypothetical protein GCM10011577_39910 [Pseudarthrobacter polychromogenes]
MTISADHTAHPDQASQVPAEDALAEAAKKFGITAEDYMLPARHQIEMVDPGGRLKPQGEQGTEPGHEYPLPGDDELLAAYEQLVVGRRVNDQNSALVRQGRMAVYPSSHGQEACQVAAALCLSKGDWHGGFDPLKQDWIAAEPLRVPNHQPTRQAADLP